MRSLYWSCRLNRLLASSAVLALAAVSLDAAAASAQPSPAGSQGQGGATVSLQAQAQELAGEVVADGEMLDQLDAAYQAAELRYAQIEVHEQLLRRGVAATQVQVDHARRALKQQALLAYMAGGMPTVGDLPAAPGRDAGIVTAYAEIVAAGQRHVMSSYQGDLIRLSAERAALAGAAGQAAVTMGDIRSDEGQAQATLAQQQAALSQVRGQLAAAYAQVQAADAQTQAAAVRASVAAQGTYSPPPGSGTQEATASPVGGVAAPTTHTEGPETATTPAAGTTPLTQPPVTQPRVTQPAVTPAPVTQPPVTPAPTAGSSQPAPGASIAIAYAEAQLGKPYQWGGAGPAAFDCSGLVMMAWAQAGVYFPHLAQDQYDMTERIPLPALLPGDLVFFGTPTDVYHVGIYVGGGEMIDAPSTGQAVSVQSIYWDTLLGAGRVLA